MDSSAAKRLHRSFAAKNAPQDDVLEIDGGASISGMEFMTTTHAATQAPMNGQGHHHSWLGAAASLAVGAAFLGLWFWLLPHWLGFKVEINRAAQWRWLAAIPSALGFAVALRCIWDFGWTGRGTPAPIAPPQRLVVVGFYRYVRNPMYVGFAAGWMGLWIIFGHADLRLIVAVAAVALGVHLFVVFFEELTLRRRFGEEYENYRHSVRRWWPRLRGRDQPE